MGGTRAIRMVVRSGRRLLRDALVAWFAEDQRLSVVGAVAASNDLLTLCVLCQPDVIVYDLGADLDEELTVLRTVRLQHPACRLIVTYEHASFKDLAAVWETGPHAVVPDSYGLEALAGTVPGEPELPDERTGPDARRLTDLERDIVAMVGGGHTAQRIAALIGMSANAVENAKRRIYLKLGVTCQSQAVARIADLGLADLRMHPNQGRHVPPIAVLYGPADANRRAVVTTLLRHRIAVVAADPAAPYRSESAAGPASQAVNVLIGPEPGDWPATSDIPTILIHPTRLTRAQRLAAISHGIRATMPLDCVGHELVPLLMFVFHGCVALHGTDRAIASGRPRLVRTVNVPLLTSREREILRSIAAGHTVRQTARSLGIAVKTVENIQARLLRKLDAKNRAGALAMAYELGLVDRRPADVIEENVG